MARPKPQARRWTTPQLAKRFGWWWREPEKAFRVAFPKTSMRERERLFRGMFNQCAFNYELAARRDLKPGLRPAYEYGVPFHKLPPDKLNDLRRRWPCRSWPTVFEVMDYDAMPGVTSVLAKLNEDIVDDGGASVRQEHMRRVVARDRIEKVEAKSGWTVPRYFRFNLGAHPIGTIVTELAKWLDAQRKNLDIKTPRANQNRANRTSKHGRSFLAIEALDIWMQLPRNEAEMTRVDPDRAIARKAKRAAKRLENPT